MTKKTWHVYILECNDSSLYTGITNDITKRMEAHKTGKGSKYVKIKGFKELIKTKSCKNKSQASKYEYTIKRLPKNKKIEWFKLNI